MKKLKITRCHVLLVLIAVSLIGWIAVPAIAADPLPSWREGPNKQLILTFVEKVNHLAAENNWQVISMKKDWERVFDFSR